MRIAVLLPTCHRPAGLRRALQTLKDTAPDLHPVVAAEADDSQAPIIAKEFGATFTVCPEPYRGCGAAWNTALRAAMDFDAYFLGSDDIIFMPGWIEAVLRAFEKLGGSGFVGINDCRKNAEKFCATHYLMTRDFIIDYNGGVAAAPCYACDYTDMEADRRARRAGKWIWAKDALVKHDWKGPYGDETYRRATAVRSGMKSIYLEREKQNFPNNFPPILRREDKFS